MITLGARTDTAGVACMLVGTTGALLLAPDLPWRHVAEPCYLATVGLVVAVIGVVAFRWRGAHRGEMLWLAVFLAGMPWVYVANWALRSGARGGSLAVELVGVVGYAALAWLGATRFPRLVGIGIAAHGLWDLAHAGGEGAVPTWYAFACGIADVGIGIYALTRASRWSSAALVGRTRG